MFFKILMVTDSIKIHFTACTSAGVKKKENENTIWTKQAKGG